MIERVSVLLLSMQECVETAKDVSNYEYGIYNGYGRGERDDGRKRVEATVTTDKAHPNTNLVAMVNEFCVSSNVISNRVNLERETREDLPKQEKISAEQVKIFVKVLLSELLQKMGSPSWHILQYHGRTINDFNRYDQGIGYLRTRDRVHDNHLVNVGGTFADYIMPELGKKNEASEPWFKALLLLDPRALKTIIVNYIAHRDRFFQARKWIKCVIDPNMNNLAWRMEECALLLAREARYFLQQLCTDYPSRILIPMGVCPENATRTPNRYLDAEKKDAVLERAYDGMMMLLR
jgi:hypothetical protein